MTERLSQKSGGNKNPQKEPLILGMYDDDGEFISIDGTEVSAIKDFAHEIADDLRESGEAGADIIAAIKAHPEVNYVRRWLLAFAASARKASQVDDPGNESGGSSGEDNAPISKKRERKSTKAEIKAARKKLRAASENIDREIGLQPDPLACSDVIDNLKDLNFEGMDRLAKINAVGRILIKRWKLETFTVPQVQSIITLLEAEKNVYDLLVEVERDLERDRGDDLSSSKRHNNDACGTSAANFSDCIVGEHKPPPSIMS